MMRKSFRFVSHHIGRDRFSTIGHAALSNDPDFLAGGLLAYFNFATVASPIGKMAGRSFSFLRAARNLEIAPEKMRQIRDDRRPLGPT